MAFKSIMLCTYVLCHVISAVPLSFLSLIPCLFLWLAGGSTFSMASGGCRTLSSMSRVAQIVLQRVLYLHLYLQCASILTCRVGQSHIYVRHRRIIRNVQRIYTVMVNPTHLRSLPVCAPILAVFCCMCTYTHLRCLPACAPKLAVFCCMCTYTHLRCLPAELCVLYTEIRLTICVNKAYDSLKPCLNSSSTE